MNLYRNYSSNIIRLERLKGKVALLSASTNGIGLAIAERFAAEGASVVVSSRRMENVNRAVEHLNALGYENVLGVKCHVSNRDDRQHLIESTLKKFGRINILVSNAGVNPYFGRISECPEEMWDKIFDVNVRSSFLLCKDTIPYLRESNNNHNNTMIGGCNNNIILMSSGAGYKPNSIPGPYPIAKTALLSLTQTLSNDLAQDNIRVNCIAPGAFKTNFAKVLTESDVTKSLLNTIPMKRFGEPFEAASVAAFLASEDASYISGETIVISGGVICRL